MNGDRKTTLRRECEGETFMFGEQKPKALRTDLVWAILAALIASYALMSTMTVVDTELILELKSWSTKPYAMFGH